MNGKIIGYVRVSTIEQNPDRQLENIVIDKKFVDYASGSTINRPQFQLMMDYVRDGDVIVVHSMDRLARNVKNLLSIIDELNSKNVEIRFIKENIHFNGSDSAMSKLLLMIMGAVAEFEYSLIKERQQEGINIAKKEGKYKGRKKVLTDEKTALIDAAMQTRKSKTEIAKELGISRVTLYQYLKTKK